MNYYNEIKKELLENELNKKIKNYSINKSDLTTYYNVGKLLAEAGKHYGENVIGKYANKLKIDLNKKSILGKFMYIIENIDIFVRKVSLYLRSYLL